MNRGGFWLDVRERAAAWQPESRALGGGPLSDPARTEGPVRKARECPWRCISPGEIVGYNVTSVNCLQIPTHHGVKTMAKTLLTVR